MFEINRVNGLNRLLNLNDVKKFEPQEQKEVSMLEQGDGVDTVSFSDSTSEKFADVRAEMEKNVPDVTTTIEEKEKAISYIDRMLACDDITPDMKEYWTNKKNEIEKEIEEIVAETTVTKNQNETDTVDASAAVTGLAGSAKIGDITAAIATNMASSVSIDQKEELVKEEVDIKQQIAVIDDKIVDVEKKLSNFFSRLFRGRSLRSELDSLKQQRAELQAKLDEVQRKLTIIQVSENMYAPATWTSAGEGTVETYEVIAADKTSYDDVDYSTEIDTPPDDTEKTDYVADIDTAVTGIVGSAKIGDITAAIATNMASSVSISQKEELMKEEASLKQQIAVIDDKIADVENKLSNFFSRLFRGRSLRRELDSLKQQRAELQTKLGEVQRKLTIIQVSENMYAPATWISAGKGAVETYEFSETDETDADYVSDKTDSSYIASLLAEELNSDD